MGVLDRFICFDLETTGIDAESSEIIEVAAFRVEKFEIVDEFHSLVSPKIAPSAQIEKITGITADDLIGQPAIAGAMKQFTQFVGSDPLFAHNAAFDAGFLLSAKPNWRLPSMNDTLLLSQIAIPRLRNHRLGTLVAALGIEHDPAHRATADARALIEVIRLLVDSLAARPFGQLEALVTLAAEAPAAEKLVDPIGPLLKEILEIAARRGMATVDAPKLDGDYLVSLDNTIGNFNGGEGAPVGGKGDIDPAQVAGTLGPGGPLARRIPGYETRESQLEMADAVCQSFNDEEILVCEAGTGTGKSLAYLVPAVLWAVRNGRRVIISTNTKNLQEQLFFKDLPLLEETLDADFRAVLLKGRGNYVCMNRWRAGKVPGLDISSEKELPFALPIATWMNETRSGDISEATGFHLFGPGRSFWSKLSAEGQPCTPAACPFFRECYVTRIRRAAQQAHVVVINHSLLFSDLVADNAVLGEYDSLIIDEGHNIEKTASDYLGQELSHWSVRELANRLYLHEGGESGLIARVNRGLGKSALSQDDVKRFQMQAARAIEMVGDLGRASTRFFDALDDLLERPDHRSRFSHKAGYSCDDNPVAAADEQRDDLLAAVESVKAEIQQLTDWLRDLGMGVLPSGDEFVADLDNRLMDLEGLRETLTSLTEATDREMVYWYEIPPENARAGVRLASAPLSVGSRLHDSLFSTLRSVVITSATLAVAGKFTYFLSRTGLMGEQGERVRTLEVGSPFDFDHQAFVAVPTWFPNPKSRDFNAAVADMVRDAVLKTRRGTLVLFTSYAQLNATYRSLSDEFHANGIQLLGQGIDGSRTALANAFRQDRDSVLFGTESFWEGVDIPGDALELLVIVKLPFAVPTEPLLVAQNNELRREGKDPFLWMTVPETAIRFRQGFGRLIRSKRDRGAVLLLDTRVVTERFGRAFLQSLPTGHHAFDNSIDLVDSLETWFAETATTSD
jgi:ATP-dependent DNA helicase DinG